MGGRDNYDQAGTHTLILHSSDGGLSWNSQLTAEEPLTGYALTNGFDFFDVRSGWLLLDPTRGKGFGGGPPQRTVLYHTTDGGGGPIGREVELPNLGGGADSGAGFLAPLLLAAAGAVALVVVAALQRRRS